MFPTKPFIFLENMVILFFFDFTFPQPFFINPQTTGQGVFTQGGPSGFFFLLRAVPEAGGVFTESHLGLLCECGVTVQL